MISLTCVICDDEPLAVKLLETYISRLPAIDLRATFNDSTQALNYLQRHPVDIALLDIQMPNLDGMSLSRLLPRQTRIIFTTAFAQYALEGYEVSAIDFLLKPIQFPKFCAAIDKARQWKESIQPRQSSCPQSIFVKVNGDLLRVNISDILYVEGMKDYVQIYLQDHKLPLTTHLTMKETEAMLPQGQFLRVSRSYIVNVDKVRRIDRNSCLYVGDQIIHITDNYRSAFDTLLRHT
jgi:two-component system LytT family response regulator